MNCEKCGKEITDQNWNCDNTTIQHNICPVGATEGRPARFASSSGSASDADEHGRASKIGGDDKGIGQPKKQVEGEPLDLSRAVQLPVSELAAVVEEWRLEAKKHDEESEEFEKLNHRLLSASVSSHAAQLNICADRIEKIIAASAPQRSGGERRKLNADLRQGASNAASQPKE